MKIVDGLLAGLAHQLGEPTGPVGSMLGRALNRGNRSLVAAAVAAVRPDDADVGDIGFGGGVGLGLLLARPGGVVHGIEMSETMLADARRRFAARLAAGELLLHAGRMEALPFDDSALDAVISTNTIYFVSDLDAVFAELARVLRPGGRLVLGIGDPAQMATMPFTRHGFRLRPVEEIVVALRSAGFRDIQDVRVGGSDRSPHVLVGDAPGS